MTYALDEPFIDSQAFVKETESYVTFPSQSDAMLASLQLFHNVPCRIMNLVFNIVTHPDFDSKHVTMRSSLDVINLVEERRLANRMAVVHARSASRDGRVMRAGFPHFILYEVLDIIHAQRMDSIRAQFEENPGPEEMYHNSMRIEEDNVLKAISLVHRTWTFPVQKALGRILHIGKPAHEMNILLDPVRKSIFGSWTSVVAMQFFCPIIKEYDREWQLDEYEYSDNVHDESRQWFENLHRIVVGLTNVKCLFIKSFASVFTEWSNFTIQEMTRNTPVHLEELTLYAAMGDSAFDLVPLVKETTLLKNLKSLSIQGAWISQAGEEEEGAMIQGTTFDCLTNLTIKLFFSSSEKDFTLLSILSAKFNPCLKALRIIDGSKGYQSLEGALTPRCAAVFKHLRSLHIQSKVVANLWLKWISPYCTSLEDFTLEICTSSPQETLFLIPANISTLNFRLITTTAAMLRRIIAIEVERFMAWLKCLPKTISSRQFLELKSVTIFLSKDLRDFLAGMGCKEQLMWLRTEMQTFEEEMSTVCKSAGVKYSLDL